MAEIVATPPLQMVAPLAVIVGNAFTDTFVVLIAVQPLLSVTVTEYVIAVVGDTTAVDVVAVKPDGLDTH